MPRMARIKTTDSIFHVMCRSISEVNLFKNSDDKLKYIGLIKKYQKIYEFKVYGYCLMDNHIHLLLDANGADISSIMHSINFSYAQYFNGIHKRHGHLFQDRFKSKIITNENYLFAVSAYIHNNVLDIDKYKHCPEKYEFSSLSIYLGLRQDPYGLVSTSFVLSLFGKNLKSARSIYRNFVYKCNNLKSKEDIEFEDVPTEYKSCRTLLPRNCKVNDIVDFIVKKTNISTLNLHIKNSRNSVVAKSLFVLLTRGLCNYKCAEICKILGNITQSRVSKLSSLAIKLIAEKQEYRTLIEDFLNMYSA